MQNVINGIKVCGKKADGLNLAQAQRPSKQSDGSYKCPAGTKACNESQLSDADQVEFAICIDSTADAQETCPITSFAYTLEYMTQSEADMYTQAVNVNPLSTTKFYYSKSMPNHAIDEVTVGSDVPCWDPMQITKAPNQSFYYAEMLSTLETCIQPNTGSYQSLDLSAGQSLTEFSLHSFLAYYMKSDNDFIT